MLMGVARQSLSFNRAALLPDLEQHYIPCVQRNHPDKSLASRSGKETAHFLVKIAAAAACLLHTATNANTSWLISDRVTEKFIPNIWLLENHLSIDPKVGLQDPDRDGFLNEDEWRHQTDPNDKHSHPPYHTKLFLASRPQSMTPRLVFLSHDVDDKVGIGDASAFQVNQRGTREKTHFLKLGETIAGTDYKLVKFVSKSAHRPSGVVADVSELTMVSLRTGDQLVLPLSEPVECFEGQAVLRDDFDAGADFQATTTQEFTLKAEPTVRYRLIALKRDGAVIVLPDGTSYLAPRIPKRLLKTQPSR